jgi:peroxiredoxin
VRAKIGERAPNLSVSKWVQGLPTNFDQEKDHIVVVEVFQVNCPGCFLHGIPETIDVYNKYRNEGVTVLGFATAFEDFDKNTLENLEILLKTGEVIGETKKALSQYGKFDDSKRPYKIPFPVGMDTLIKETDDVSQT